MNVCGYQPSLAQLADSPAAMALVEAAQQAHKAVDTRGLKIMLCRALDKRDVYATLMRHAEWMRPDWIPMSIANGETSKAHIARNLAILANLYAAHLDYESELRPSPHACP